MKEEISYIAKRYRKGCFSVDKGWQRLAIAPSYYRKRWRVAAASISIIIFSAAAGIVLYKYNVPSQPEFQQVEYTEPKKDVVRIIDFEDTTLPTVISKIKEVYGVEVLNIPANADTFRISLHYEGNAADLIESINEILDTQMSIEE